MGKYIQIFEKKVIERTAGVPYLIRWNLLGLGKDSCIFSIKIHKILISDDACIHDHPWAFLSIILWGGYTETAVYTFGNHSWGIPHADEKSQKWVVTKSFGRGSILWRPANWKHKLDINPKKPATTLVFTFRKTKKWGFFTTKGWIPWYQYSKEKDC